MQLKWLLHQLLSTVFFLKVDIYSFIDPPHTPPSPVYLSKETTKTTMPRHETPMPLIHLDTFDCAK